MLHRHVDVANPPPAGGKADPPRLSLTACCRYLRPLFTAYPRYLSRRVRSGLTASALPAASAALSWPAPTKSAFPVAANCTDCGTVLAAAAALEPGASKAPTSDGGALAWGGGLAARRHRSALADRGPRPAVRDASSASSRLPSLVTACGDARKSIRV